MAQDSTDFKWNDSFLYSIGANYQTDDKWLIRSGLAYEKDATKDSTREVRIPSSNRIWASLGLNYKFSDGVQFDAAYVHQFFKNAKVNIGDTNNTNSGGSLSARYKTKVDVFSFAVRLMF